MALPEIEQKRQVYPAPLPNNPQFGRVDEGISKQSLPGGQYPVERCGIYLDHAAATYLAPEVEDAMAPYGQKIFGNPSSIHDSGRAAKEAIAQARARIAKILNCFLEEIIFTGSGTMSDNLAIFGIARANKIRGKHIITTAIEHHAVLKPVEYLRDKEGFDITVLSVDSDGLACLSDLEKAVKPDTILISVMYANNEIGTIQPIAEIGRLVRRLNKIRTPHGLPRIYFHTDACQAAGALSLDVKALGVDLLTMNGSKIYGPKGSGVLFAARGVNPEPLIFGGGQERGLVSGTENVAAIVGLAAALELSQKNRESENRRLIELRDELIAGILKTIPKSRLNGHPVKRLPNNINVTILDVEGEAMLLYLNEYGIYAATGSACDSTTLDPSHVILALGLPYEFAHGSMRFTLGRLTTKEDIDYVLEIFPPIVETLREVSPVKLEMNPTLNKHAKILQHAPALKVNF